MTQPIISDDFATITLAPDPRGNYVTWANGKKQIRTGLKLSSFTPVGLFRARKENKNEFSIMARDPHGNMYHVLCARKPGATILAKLITP